MSTEEFTAEQITTLVNKNWTLQYLRPLLYHPHIFFRRYAYLLLRPRFLLELLRRVTRRLFTARSEGREPDTPSPIQR